MPLSMYRETYLAQSRRTFPIIRVSDGEDDINRQDCLKDRRHDVHNRFHLEEFCMDQP